MQNRIASDFWNLFDKIGEICIDARAVNNKEADLLLTFRGKLRVAYQEYKEGLEESGTKDAQ